MKEIIPINHVGLRVRDLEIYCRLYDKLEFKFLAGSVGPEPDAFGVMCFNSKQYLN